MRLPAEGPEPQRVPECSTTAAMTTETGVTAPGPAGMEDLHRAAATAIDVDSEDLLNRPTVAANGDSPSKRTRWDQAAPMPASSQSSAGISLAQLVAALGPLTEGVTQMKQRMTDLESQVAAKVDKTLDIVQILDQRQREQGAKIEQVQDSLRDYAAREKARDLTIQVVLKRIDMLEDSQLQHRAWKHTRFESEEGEGPRTPALVFDGWSLDLDEAEVLDKAKKAVADLALDIDLTEAFMPGKHRGFLIVPLMAKLGEDRAKLQRRAISSVEVVRKAALPAGGTNKAGKPSQLWLAICESPEQRRRTRQMSKSKRAVLEGADKISRSLAVRADYRSGSLWLDDRRIAGLGKPPAGLDAATSLYGWLDVAAVAEATGETKEQVESRWKDLVGTID